MVLKSKTFWKLVDRFIELIETETDFPVLIYDTNGMIIRATDKSRIGDLHAGAEKIMRSQVKEYAVTAEEAALNPLVREGYSCPIIVDGQIMGGFGITGKLELARPLARTAVKMIDAWIEKVHFQDQLHESEKKFRNLFENASNGIFQATLEGRFLTANPALAHILGYASPHLLMTDVTDIANQLYVCPEERRRLIETLVENGNVSGFVTQYRRRDGKIIDISIDSRLMQHMESGVQYIEGHLEDITEKRKTEAAIRLSEEKYFKAFNSSPVWVVLSSLKSGRYIEVNETFLRTMGYERKEIIGRTSMEIKAWVDPNDRLNITRELNENGSVRNYEVKRRTRSDTILTMLFSADIIDISGEDCLLSVSLDISDRKRTQEALAKAQNSLANIIDSMPSVIVGVDIDGKVTQWNSQARLATGLYPTAAVGRPLEKVYPRLVKEMKHVREAMAAGQVITDSRQDSDQDGEIRHEDVTIYPLVANGVEGAVIRVDDVTKRVRIEEMMIQSEKMLSVGGLAAGMAHEINNPLAGMIQTSSVMANRLTSPDLAANRRAADDAGTTMAAIDSFMQSRGILRMLENIRQSGHRAAEIVSNMLSFARKSDAAFSTYELADLLDQTVDLAGSDYDLKKKFDFRQIKIVREYGDGIPPVPCERAKIQQVLLNLLRNGAEAMHEKWKATAGEVPGDQPRFTLRLANEVISGMVRIEIEDNGPGMDTNTRRRVFEPFFTTKPSDKGTGLGLSVSYFIVTENHGGELSVKSTYGRGSTFVLRLPVQGQ